MLLKSKRSPGFTLCISFAVYFLYLNCVPYLYNYITNQKRTGFEIFTRANTLLEFLGFLGIVVSSVLSAFGSVQMIFNYIIYPVFGKKLIEHFKQLELKMTYLNSKMHILNGVDSEAATDSESSKPLLKRRPSLKDQLINKSVEAKDINQSLTFLTGREEKLSLTSSYKRLKGSYTLIKTKFYLIGEKIGARYRENVLPIKDRFFLTCQLWSAKVVAWYCSYKVLNTFRHLIFSNYSEINLIIDKKLVSIIDLILKQIVSVIDEQHFEYFEQILALIITVSIILTNMRSFLNTVVYLHQTIFDSLTEKENIRIEMVLMAFFVGLFYITSAIFLVMSLPRTYR